MKKTRIALFLLQAFVGIGAMAGGLACLLNPQSPIGVSTDILKNSPFTDFLVPGILLFGVIGVGNLFSAILFFFHLKYQGYVSSIFTWALMIWIVVQCIMLRSVVFLHVLFFVLGAVGAFFSFLLLAEQRLLPANIVLLLCNQIKTRLSGAGTETDG